ncbi:MAG: right-handed parallel beta-helix repeat-containing protein [Candidatus Lokiarchaeota archaeon]|nr:right-handed parallel beta-helix repeat-containing protein [Candidatus Lokiarchaeota archaeon]
MVSNDNINNRRTLKTSQYEISYIHIYYDNWSGYDGQPWFHLGDGTENDPHRIENVTINPNFIRTAIYIYISYEPFIIQNCTILNAQLDFVWFAGIELQEVENGKIRNNTIYNSYRGIYCSYAQNLNITNNRIYNCFSAGIRIDYSLDIEISNNEIYETDYNGLYIWYDCSNIHIIGNTIYNNTGGAAIYFTGSSSYINHDNYVYNNTLRDCYYGILFIAYTNTTEVMYNEIFNNIGTGVDIRNNCYDNYFFLNNFSNTHNALDYTSFNYWDNGLIGNLWHDYISSQGGYDLDDDGIGDIPYKIYNNWDKTINTVNDSFPICDDGDNIVPIISIDSPMNDTIYNSPPTITVSIYDKGEIDSQWYEVLNTSETHTFSGTVFQIDVSIWNNQMEGVIAIRVFVNDTGGNSNSSDLQIIKDTIAPSVVINNPSDGTLFSEPPEILVSIFDIHINETWYTIIGSDQNYTFTTSSFELNALLWAAQDEGSVIIRIYANDTVGNIGFADLTVLKDSLNPLLTINSPLSGTQFGTTPPTINITITELHLDKFWFTINDSSALYFITASTGENVFAMESSIWDVIPEGHILITFFANDTLGKMGTISITIIKEIPEGPKEPPSIPGYDIFLLLIISLCSLVITNRIVHRKKIINS